MAPEGSGVYGTCTKETRGRDRERKRERERDRKRGKGSEREREIYIETERVRGRDNLNEGDDNVPPCQMNRTQRLKVLVNLLRVILIHNLYQGGLIWGGALGTNRRFGRNDQSV